MDCSSANAAFHPTFKVPLSVAFALILAKWCHPRLVLRDRLRLLHIHRLVKNDMNIFLGHIAVKFHIYTSDGIDSTMVLVVM